MKTCRVCEKTAHKEQFVFDWASKDNRKNLCKACHAQRERERRAGKSTRKRGRPRKEEPKINFFLIRGEV